MCLSASSPDGISTNRPPTEGLAGWSGLQLFLPVSGCVYTHHRPSQGLAVWGLHPFIYYTADVMAKQFFSVFMGCVF